MREKAPQAVFYLGSTVLSWASKKQGVVAFSSCDVEYVTASSTVCEAIWLWNNIKELDHPQEDLIVIFVDNKSAIKLTKCWEKSVCSDTNFCEFWEIILRPNRLGQCNGNKLQNLLRQ